MPEPPDKDIVHSVALAVHMQMRDKITARWHDAGVLTEDNAEENGEQASLGNSEWAEEVPF